MIETAPVYWFDEIDSTSEEAKRRAQRGDIGPVWIAAKSQTLGRGRLGRSWVSPVGNLYTTVLFPEPGGFEIASRIPFAAALAIRDIARIARPGLAVELKWPNDVRVRGQKLCGILTETGTANGVVWIALGMGINITHAPSDLAQKATSLRAEGAPEDIRVETLLDDLRPALSRRLLQAQEAFETTLSDWMAAAEGLGKPMVAGPEGHRSEGVFQGLANDGALILRLSDNSVRTIRAGEVDLIKQVR
ncbi:MAG: biotin--[acetyl-CoA-carboxylase] ligase [Pseudomonadota bacterium]